MCLCCSHIGSLLCIAFSPSPSPSTTHTSQLGVEMMEDLKLLSAEDLGDIGMPPSVAEKFMFSVGSRFQIGQRVMIVNLTKVRQAGG